MSRQIRIQAGPPIEAALRATGGDLPTARLNAIAERYLEMIDLATQHPAEWPGSGP